MDSKLDGFKALPSPHLIMSSKEKDICFLHCFIEKLRKYEPGIIDLIETMTMFTYEPFWVSCSSRLPLYITIEFNKTHQSNNCLIQPGESLIVTSYQYNIGFTLQRSPITKYTGSTYYPEYHKDGKYAGSTITLIVPYYKLLMLFDQYGPKIELDKLKVVGI